MQCETLMTKSIVNPYGNKVKPRRIFMCRNTLELVELRPASDMVLVYSPVHGLKFVAPKFVGEQFKFIGLF